MDAYVPARYVVNSPAFRADNLFENNIIMGDCVFGGEKTGVSKTHVKNNYISGEITLNNEFVDQSGNKTVTAKTDGEKVVIERSSGLRKTKYSKAIR